MEGEARQKFYVEKERRCMKFSSFLTSLYTMEKNAAMIKTGPTNSIHSHPKILILIFFSTKNTPLHPFVKLT